MRWVEEDHFIGENGALKLRIKVRVRNLEGLRQEYGEFGKNFAWDFR